MRLFCASARAARAGPRATASGRPSILLLYHIVLYYIRLYHIISCYTILVLLYDSMLLCYIILYKPFQQASCEEALCDEVLALAPVYYMLQAMYAVYYILYTPYAIYCNTYDILYILYHILHTIYDILNYTILYYIIV